MKIFIPTRDRLNAQFTWENLTPALRAVTILVCPPEEVETHIKAGRTAIARPPLPLAGVRQWLVDEACAGPDQGLQPIIMLDDDLAFFVRKNPSAHNLKPAKQDDDAELDALFSRLYRFVAGPVESCLAPDLPAYPERPVVHAGLSPRQGNNWAFPHRYEMNTRMNAVHCILPAALKHYGVRYDDVDMMEDYHVTLRLFELGEDNAAITDGAWDQCKGSGAPGGFTHYRTSERQDAAAHRLAGLHPLSVKAVKKEPKTGAGGFAGERTDVRVQWKQARKKATQTATFHR